MSKDDTARSWVHRELPVGQVETTKFPVIGERDPGESMPSLEEWRLDVCGAVKSPRVWSWSELLESFKPASCTMDIHCVTGWSRRASRWQGIALEDVLDASGVCAEGQFVRFEAYSSRGHDTSLPLNVARAHVLLAHTLDDERLTREHGGPLRVVVPSRWFYKSLKWVRRIEVVESDSLGFWERTSGYHNNADPWAQDPERYVFGAFPPSKLSVLRRGRRVDRWRGVVVLGVDLSGWDPEERDLHHLVLKACNLRGASLRGCSLRGANLTRSDLRGADLREADLSGADLEGADLRGADLRGACLHGSWLTAVRCMASEGEMSVRLEGAFVRGVHGVLEEVEEIFRMYGLTTT